MPRLSPMIAAPGVPPTIMPPPPARAAGVVPRSTRVALAGAVPTPAGSNARDGSPPPAAGGRVPPPRRSVGWLEGLADWVRDAAKALRPSRSGRRLHEFADLIESAREPAQVEAALVRFAAALSGACHVELLLDRDGPTHPGPRRIAVWSEGSRTLTAEQVEGLGYPLSLGLWCGDHYQMTLQVHARAGRRGRWPRPVVRRLTTLCAMAAAAERGLHAGRRAGLEAPTESSAAIRDATFLNAILPYALSQAQRHREPLSVFCLAIDRLSAIQLSHGTAAADAAVRRLAGAVARTLRGSDLVARLDDDRVVVVLPNTGAPDALCVAEVMRSAIAGACLATDRTPELTVSVGVACFPEDAREMAPLLAAADEAMDRARARGPHQVAADLPPVAPIPPPPDGDGIAGGGH